MPQSSFWRGKKKKKKKKKKRAPLQLFLIDWKIPKKHRNLIVKRIRKKPQAQIDMITTKEIRVFGEKVEIRSLKC